MKNSTLQIVAALVFVLLLVALADPFMVLMPTPVALLCLVLAAALAAVFAGFVLFEGRGDERDDAHRAESGRAAYLVGLLVLTFGLLFEGFLTHHVDPWLLASLAGMILAKTAVRLWIDSRR